MSLWEQLEQQYWLYDIELRSNCYFGKILLYLLMLFIITCLKKNIKSCLICPIIPTKNLFFKLSINYSTALRIWIMANSFENLQSLTAWVQYKLVTSHSTRNRFDRLSFPIFQDRYYIFHSQVSEQFSRWMSGISYECSSLALRWEQSLRLESLTANESLFGPRLRPWSRLVNSVNNGTYGHGQWSTQS